MLLIGPHGTPAGARMSNHSCALRSASRASSSGRSSARCALRSGIEPNRGSSSSSGAPIAMASRRNWWSLAAMMISSPSPVGSGSYGNRLRWALPSRFGTTPPVSTAEVWLTSPDSAAESRLVSHQLSLPGALPVLQRGQHGHRGVQPGDHVEDRDTGPVRRAVRVAGQAHQPGDGLHQQVVAGQGRAAPLGAGTAPKPEIEQ